MPSSQVSAVRLGVVILAAGRSQRMGQPKLLLPWGETSVMGHLVNQWRALGAGQIAAVCASDAQVIRAELIRLGFSDGTWIENPSPERGMFSSIQCAAAWPAWHPDLTHWAVVLGDQPHLRSSTLQAVLALVAEHPQDVCQPSRKGHPRHPVVLPRAWFNQCAASTARSLKEFLAGCPCVNLEMNDPGLDLDMDTPEDYERVKTLE
jgi:molybdenum cofactor cytidylyltransferase